MHRQIKFHQYSTISFGGWGLETSHDQCQSRSVKLALKMTTYRYFTRESLTYPTKVPSLSGKQVEKTNAEEDTSGRGKYNKYTPEERALLEV